MNKMTHDFKRFPELTNSQMGMYYFDSPHKQIREDFFGRVVKVHDGDTITISCDFRDFNFPIRFANIMAPELSEEGGFRSRDWLASQILGQEVEIKVNKNNPVEKWGRLLGRVFFKGFDVGEESKASGMSLNLEEEGNKRDDLIDLLILKTEWA
jgi:endonuclease YncB( thermonuclease family)